MNNFDFNVLVQHYKEQMSKLMRRSFIISIVSILCYLAIIFIIIKIPVKSGLILLYLIIATGILALILKTMLKDKPLNKYFEIIIPEILNKYYVENQDRYHIKMNGFIDMTDSKFTKELKLFFGHAILNENETVKINLNIIVTGRKGAILFQGFYISIEHPTLESFSLRTFGDPPPFNLLKQNEYFNVDNLKLFVKVANLKKELNQEYINLMRRIQKILNEKKLYLFVHNNKIHFIYEANKLIKKPKKFNINTYQATEIIITNLLDIAIDIKNTFDNHKNIFI